VILQAGPRVVTNMAAIIKPSAWSMTKSWKSILYAVTNIDLHLSAAERVYSPNKYIVICESWCSHRSDYKNSLLKFKIMEVNGQLHSQAAISLRKELKPKAMRLDRPHSWWRRGNEEKYTTPTRNRYLATQPVASSSTKLVHIIRQFQTYSLNLLCNSFADRIT
jgi:hypothetical protein